MRHAVLCLGIFSFAIGSCQEVRLVGSGGYGADAPYASLFNPATIIRFEGKVTGRYVSPPLRAMAEGVMLIVRTPNGGSSLVELGPAWYVDRQDAQIRVGDKVEVVGSKIFLDGRGSILATNVIKGKSVLALRESNGRPYWDARRVANARADAARDPRSISGTIRRFDVFSDRPNADPMLFAEVVGSDEVIRKVVLGPRWFIERQDFGLAVGDEVFIETWTPVAARAPFPYAQSIRRGREVLRLRSTDGRHAWEAWSRDDR